MPASERYQLLYDGACPVCRREVLWLHRRRPAAIEAVDIAAPEFDAALYGLTAREVDAALYGIQARRQHYRGHGQPAGGLPAGWAGLADGLDRVVAGPPAVQRVLPRLRPEPDAYRQAAGP